MPSGGLEFFFYLFQKEMWLKISLSSNLLREIGGLKGEVGRCAKWRSVVFLFIFLSFNLFREIGGLKRGR